MLIEIKTSRDGVVVIALASHHCGSGSIPGLDAIWVKFGVGCLLCSERFFCGISGFPLSTNMYI